MDIAFKCPLCEEDFRLEAALAGTEFRCPTCLKISLVSEPEEAPAQTAPATAPPGVLPPPIPAPPTLAKKAHTLSAQPQMRVARSLSVDAEDARMARRLTEAYQRVTAEVGKLIVGQEEVIEQLLIAIFARSHCLLEGVPGLAKTYMVKTLSDALQLSFRRVQFTPDLMPADITGTDIISEDPATGRRGLAFLKGPLFAQMILADEINRSPPKTQAALLEAMQERQVTANGVQYKLPNPFFVLATQNPIEQEGTYPLPEAQLDRFMMNIRVSYPTEAEEIEIVTRTTSSGLSEPAPVLTAEDIIRMQALVREIPVAEHVVRHAIHIVRATRVREDGQALKVCRDYLAWGAGPRASQFLVLAAKAKALLEGATHATVDHVHAIALPVMRHRIVTNFNAEADGVKGDDVVRLILDAVRNEGSARSLDAVAR